MLNSNRKSNENFGKKRSETKLSGINQSERDYRKNESFGIKSEGGIEMFVF